MSRGRGRDRHGLFESEVRLMPDLTLGRDVSCTTGLRTGRLTTGARLVAEAFYRRLTTPRGMLRGGEEETLYGLDLTALVGTTVTEGDRSALAGRIIAQLSLDERATDIAVEVEEETLDDGNVRLRIAISASTADGPFELVIGASSVTVDLLRINAEAA